MSDGAAEAYRREEYYKQLCRNYNEVPEIFVNEGGVECYDIYGPHFCELHKRWCEERNYGE